MVRVTSLKSSISTLKYFESALIQMDGSYYSENSKIIGKWYGSLAKTLGLEIGSEVTKEQFKSIINNRNPIDGSKLTPRDSSGRRTGYDLTFNAPKSLSIVHAILDDDDILKAHRQAVLTAMNEVEKAIQTQNGQGKNKQYLTTSNGLYAVFEHLTARPIETTLDGKSIVASDCHIHTHSILMNATHFDQKNRIQAIEMGTVKRESGYYEALYHSELAKLIKEAGYEIENDKNGRFEIKGIERSTIEKFSNRTKQINAEAEKKGITDPKLKDQIGAKTRAKKSKDAPQELLLEIWKSRLTPGELNSIQMAKKMSLKEAKEKSTDSASSSGVQSILIKHAIDLSLAHHLERKSVANEKQVIGYAIKQGLGLFRPSDVITALKQRSDVIGVQSGNTRVITTKAMIEAESSMLSFAVSERNKYAAIHPDYKIKNEILNKDQRNAIHHVLNSRDKIMMIGGEAGTGKTTLAFEVKTAIEETGKKLYAFTISADASRGVLQDKGFEGATTIEALLQSSKIQNDLKNQVILIDEAAMVGTKSMNEIFQVAKTQNARLILAGDWKQHHAVSAGDAMRALEERAKLSIARVKEVVRQNNAPELKKVVQALAKGDQEKAFKLLDKNGHIIEIEDTKTRDEQIAKDYAEALKRGKTAMVVSPIHSEGIRVTEAIRTKLKSENLITGDEQSFNTKKALSFTGAEKQDIQKYSPGMVVQFHKRTPEYRHGTDYEVDSINMNTKEVLVKTPQGKVSPLNLGSFDNFQVYQKSLIGIAQGDLLRITNNGKDLSGKPIHNGNIFKVAGFDEQGNIKLDNNRIISKDYGHMNLGYYRTSYAAEGKDAQVLLLSQSSLTKAAAGQEQFYVSVSRGCEQVKIYTDDKKDLKDSVSRKASRMQALDLYDADRLQKLQRKAHEQIGEHIREFESKEKSKSQIYEFGKDRGTKSEVERSR